MIFLYNNEWKDTDGEITLFNISLSLKYKYLYLCVFNFSIECNW